MCRSHCGFVFYLHFSAQITILHPPAASKDLLHSSRATQTVLVLFEYHCMIEKLKYVFV